MPRSRSPRTVAPLVPALALLLAVLTACGEDASPTPLAEISTTPSTSASAGPRESSSPEAEPPAVTAYRAWLAALDTQDARAACARHAPQLTIDLRYEAILLKRARLGDPCTDFVAVLWEQPDREYDPSDIEVTQLTDEDALLAVDFPGEDQTVRMIQQSTRWLVEESVARSGTSEPPDPAEADSDDPRRWLAVWCDLELEMSPSELIGLMGAASGTYTIADGGEPQLYWTQDQYDFRAYLDTDPPDGRTIDLVGDYDRLTTAERVGLTCPELR
ncbi:hypothetical protein [Nocardioides sp.]|uniref:hypothetical protein n=1 Tax=Nocardioides sp. TaxID=35761 RepID=UPI002609FAA8|nr:hypothetical protein [Nocardioides sp.]